MAFVGTSNYTAGQDLAKWWIKKLGGKGKIAMVGMPTLSNIRDRIDGMKNVFATSEIEIVHDRRQQDRRGRLGRDGAPRSCRSTRT